VLQRNPSVQNAIPETSKVPFSTKEETPVSKRVQINEVITIVQLNSKYLEKTTYRDLK
jgi:hypothetical protein